MAESRAGTGNTQNENVVSGTSRKWKTTGEGKKKNRQWLKGMSKEYILNFKIYFMLYYYHLIIKEWK